MENKRRTQADRTASTRAALIGAARRLFAAHGFAGVGTDAIVQAAGVSRGALYHHFADKTELFAAVIDDLEAEVTTRVVEEMEVTSGDFVDAGVRALEAWLTICAAPDVSRIVLVDGPSVIGWERWREVSRRNMLGLIESALVEATEGGMLVTLPSEALAHILLAAADEAAMYVAMAGDPVAARRDVVAVQRHLLESLLRRPAP